MASIDFYINTTGFDFDLDTAGDGLGFFGDGGFGESVPVGSYQGTTFVTDGLGSTMGAQGQNVKYASPTEAVLGSTAGPVLLLQNIPNYQSTLNIRFTNSSPVKVQNCQMLIYDRVNIANGAVGVTTKAAEIINTEEVQGPTGSGDTEWITPAGTTTPIPFANSPGEEGHYAGDGIVETSTRNDTRHDWYCALSASPDSIGNKTDYGLYFSLEYI